MPKNSYLEMYAIGWDAGSWLCSGRSQDALVAISVSGKGIKPIGKPFVGRLSVGKHARSVQKILTLLRVQVKKAIPVVICVDAALGLPLKAQRLFNHRYLRQTFVPPPERNHLDNTFLFRVTDRFIAKRFGVKPLSVIGDRMGNPSSKALAAVSSLARRHGSHCVVLPFNIKWRDIAYPKYCLARYSLHIIETYPAAAKQSQSFASMRFLDGRRIANVGRGDLADAWRCAAMAVCYGKTIGLTKFNQCPSVVMPVSNWRQVKQEGWIFCPTDGKLVI